MRPTIDQGFWSDPDIEGQKAGVKLCALWLITNSQTSILGLCGASVSRFTFETGLPATALEATLTALPRSFIRVGSVIFIRNYVRHQFGSGEKLMRNNFYVALKSAMTGIRDEKLREIILADYPEFKGVQTPPEGLISPSEAKPSEVLPKPSEGLGEYKRREEKRSKEQSRAEGSAEGRPPRGKPQSVKDAEAFEAEWQNAYRQANGRVYVIKKGADRGATNQLLKIATAEELLTLARRAWAHQGGFHCKSAASISGFYSRYNDIQHELQNGNGHLSPGAKLKADRAAGCFKENFHVPTITITDE